MCAMGNPKVSCITTTHNRSKVLPRAIKSVQNQTLEDWELIIVDDASTDDTEEVVKPFLKDKRIKYIKRERNHGNHTKPKNEGILASKGDYICYLDDDNEYLPNFMETLLLEIEMGSYDVVYGDMRMFQDEDDDRGQPAIALDFDPQFLLNRSYIDTNEVLHKRDAVFRVGGWDETLPRFADWNLFVRMAKAGLSFRRIPVFLTKYYLSKGNSAEKYPVESWQDPNTGLLMFDPTWFSPSSCYIYLPYLGDDREEENNPRVAIFTITYDRLEYTEKMYTSMKDSTEYSYHWYVFDNGSTDGTKTALYDFNPWYMWINEGNKGLTYASNHLIDEILNHDYEIIIKVDNDCLFLTKGWLEDMVDMWKRNHNLYMAPYPEGLVDHPGGSWRVGHSTIGEEFVEVTEHLSGICCAIDANAYRNFRWRDEFYHGQQDSEASQAFINQGYMPCVIPRHRIQHMDTTAGQQEKYPDYFDRRKKEKTTKVKRSYEEIQDQESAFSENTIWGKRVQDSIKKFGKYLQGTVLDVGCNDGVAMVDIEKMGHETKGIDISPEKVKRAQSRGLDVVEGKMEDVLPTFDTKSFGTVFMSHTLEHADDIQKVVNEIQRIAKRAIIIVPIEEETSNPAHTSAIRSPEYLKSLFKADVVHEEQPDRLEKEYVVILDF